MSLHIIALHGAGMNAQVWGGIAPHLAAAGYGAAFQPVTLPGHREGDDAAKLLDNVGDMAKWLRGQIDAVASDKTIVLLGHSLGAAVAFAAADHPRVGGVIAVASAPRMPVNADLLALTQSDPAAAQALIVKWGCDSRHPQADAVRHVVTQIMQRTPAQALAADMAACAAMDAVTPCAKKTLVVSARFDKMTPVEQGSALAALHQAEHVVIDGGHMLPCEHAPELGQAITAFLSSF